MITTAMILAAGRGERLRPLTDTLPKPLLQVGQHALIEWHLLRLHAAGIRKVVINLYWLGETLIQTLGDGSRYGLEIHYSPEATLLNTGGGLANALPLLGESPFLLVNGDVWSDYPFDQLTLSEQADAHLILVPNPPQHPKGDFALSGNRLQTIQADLPSYTYSGIALFHPRAFAGVSVTPFPLVDLIRSLIEQNRCEASLYQGVWSDIGTPERLQQLRDQWQEETLTR
jgi:MurNAc alpha-1-phosphate uridylyltransferase